MNLLDDEEEDGDGRRIGVAMTTATTTGKPSAPPASASAPAATPAAIRPALFYGGSLPRPPLHASGGHHHQLATPGSAPALANSNAFRGSGGVASASAAAAFAAGMKTRCGAKPGRWSARIPNRDALTQRPSNALAIGALVLGKDARAGTRCAMQVSARRRRALRSKFRRSPSLPPFFFLLLPKQKKTQQKKQPVPPDRRSARSGLQRPTPRRRRRARQARSAGGATSLR